MGARAVPITAVAAVSALGADAAAHREALRAGRSGLGPCALDVPFAACVGAVRGELPAPPPRLAAWDSRVVRIALAAWPEIEPAARGAIARWGARRVGLFLGTSTGGIPETDRAFGVWAAEGKLPSSYDYARQHPLGAFAEVVRAVAGLEGPTSVVSTACSSGAKVFASARRAMALGVVDAAIVGGVDALCQTTVRGFHALGVLAAEPCRPFAAGRPGMNIGEGAAFALLEREASAERPPRAWLRGVGESSDAHHMSTPEPEGRGALAAMRAALADADVPADAVDHVNAHGTGTQHNDVAEARAIHALFGGGVPVASTKSYTGHMLGAAGAIEAVFAIESIEGGFVPGNLGVTPRDPEIAADLDLPEEARTMRVRAVLSSSFAFGGSNCALLIGAAS